jgi:hypothetical protein
MLNEECGMMNESPGLRPPPRLPRFARNDVGDEGTEQTERSMSWNYQNCHWNVWKAWMNA